jgi:2-methylisocitrate lyase-like PEP mutase family enzyme
MPCLPTFCTISRVPHFADIVFGGLTTAVLQSELASTGFAAVLRQCFPALQAALQSVHEVLGSLKRSGSLGEVRDRLVSFEERQSAVRKHMFDKMEAVTPTDSEGSPP